MITTPEVLAQEVVDLAVNGGWTDEQLPYVQWFAPRVDAGAAFMDAIYPEWPVPVLEAAGYEEFRMQDADRCVLGHTAVAIAGRLLDGARDIVADYSATPNFHSIHYLLAMQFRVDDETSCGNVPAANAVTRALGLSLEDGDCTDDDEASLAWGVLGDLWLMHARRRRRLTPVESDALRAEINELHQECEARQVRIAELVARLHDAGEMVMGP